MAGFGAASAGTSVRPAAQVRTAARLGATVAILIATMVGLGACSSMEWADPTGWFESDEPPPPSTTNPPAGEAASPEATSDRFPNLSRVPPRPVEVTSNGERTKAVDALATDSANARHTDEELRARPADSNAPPPAPRSPVTPLPPAAPNPQPSVQDAPDPQSPADRAPVEQESLQPAPATQQVAQAAPEPAAQGISAPAPAQQEPGPQQNGQQEQPVALQPPAPTAPVQPPVQPAVPPGANQAQGGVSDTFSQALAQSSATTLPPKMAQATMMQPSSAGGPATAAAAGSNLPAPGSSQLLAVIRFGNGDTKLGNDDRMLLRKVARYYKGLGGKGALSVVGYASSRTGNMDSSSHRQLNYSLSERRANAVTAELRRRGVAADQIRTTAGADSAPVYYEAMPIAEDYNRRVEIYLVN